MGEIIHKSLKLVKRAVWALTIYFLQIDNLLQVNHLAFTFCEKSGITVAPMPRPPLTERLRGFLYSRFKKEKGSWGTAADLARFSHNRPGGSKIKASELSAFINPKKGRRGITIDDLDDIAAFFRLPLAGLFGEESALSSLEQRMLWAFRALAPVTQEHFLALLEVASIAPRVGKSLIPTAGVSHTMRSTPLQIEGQTHGGRDAGYPFSGGHRGRHRSHSERPPRRRARDRSPRSIASGWPSIGSRLLALTKPRTALWLLTFIEFFLDDYVARALDAPPSP